MPAWRGSRSHPYATRRIARLRLCDTGNRHPLNSALEHDRAPDRTASRRRSASVRRAPPSQLRAKDAILFNQVRGRVRLLAIQPADQDREPHLERRHVDHDASLPRSRHFRKTFSLGVSSFVPETQLRPFYVCSDTACCVRCRGEIDCSDPSLYPSPACRPLNCRLHLQRRSVRWTTAAHDARRICGTKDGARRDPRSASRHRRYRHATASSPNVCSAPDIDRIIEHLEAAVTRLRAIQESLGAER